MLAVVIAGDCARADIRARADPGVAQIAEVVGFGPLAQAGLFQLHEVAHVGVGFQFRAGAQPRKRPHKRALAHTSILQMRKGADFRALADQGVAHHAVRGHGCAAPDLGPAADFTGAAQFRAGLHPGQGAHPDQVRRVQNHARGQQLFRRAGAQQFFQAGKFQRGVDAQQTVVPAAFHAAHRIIFRHGQTNDVRDVVFAALIVVVQAGQQRLHGGQAEPVHARVDFAAFRAVAGRIVILGLHDAEHPALLAHHPAVRAGIVRHDGGKGQIRARGLSQEIAHQGFGEQRRVAVDHQQMGAARFGQRGQSLHQSVTRAELFGLKNQAGVRKGRLHHLGPVSHHHPDIFSKNRPQGHAHIGQHGLAQNRLQNLGPVRVHAGALARRQNESRVFRHTEISLRRRASGETELRRQSNSVFGAKRQAAASTAGKLRP